LRIELILLAVPGHPHPGTVNSTIRSAAKTACENANTMSKLPNKTIRTHRLCLMRSPFSFHGLVHISIAFYDSFMRRN